MQVYQDWGCSLSSHLSCIARTCSSSSVASLRLWQATAALVLCSCRLWCRCHAFDPWRGQYGVQCRWGSDTWKVPWEAWGVDDTKLFVWPGRGLWAITGRYEAAPTSQHQCASGPYLRLVQCEGCQGVQSNSYGLFFPGPQEQSPMAITPTLMCFQPALVACLLRQHLCSLSCVVPTHLLQYCNAHKAYACACCVLAHMQAAGARRQHQVLPSSHLAAVACAAGARGTAA